MDVSLYDNFDMVREIDAAMGRVRRFAPMSPLVEARGLSKEFGRPVFLKLEIQEPIFSFKWRGPANKLLQLKDEKEDIRIIAASAGNHAQGVAWVAGELGMESTIVMPLRTAKIKKTNVERLGGKIDLHGNNFGEALQYALDLTAQDRSLTFIHPYDDPVIMAGAGTIFREIQEQYSGKIGGVFAPVGGGGVAAGVFTAAADYDPDILRIAVEPFDNACFNAALKTGHPVALPRTGTHTPGLAVPQVGAKTFFYLQKYCHEGLLVRNNQINWAIKTIWDETRRLVETSGAVAVAGMLDYLRRDKGGKGALIAVVTGANIDLKDLRLIADFKDTGGSREMLLDVKMPADKQALTKLCSFFENENVTEFEYRTAEDGRACAFIRLPFPDYESRHGAFLAEIKKAGFEVTNSTKNPVVKDHGLSLVRTLPLRFGEEEKLCRIKFPYSPGELQRMIGIICDKAEDVTFLHYNINSVTNEKLLVAVRMRDEAFKPFRATLRDNGCTMAQDERKNARYREFRLDPR